MNVLVIPEDFRKDQFILQPIKERGLQDDPGYGRKTLSLEAARKYRRMSSRCREDLQVLETRLDAWIHKREVLSWNEAWKKL